MRLSSVRGDWLYFEAGHGKGPCNGVGGAANRRADEAVKRSVASIQTAQDFFDWGNAKDTAITYLFTTCHETCHEAIARHIFKDGTKNVTNWQRSITPPHPKKIQALLEHLDTKRQEIWVETVQATDFTHFSRKVWSVVRQQPNMPIKASKIAQHFVK